MRTTTLPQGDSHHITLVFPTADPGDEFVIDVQVMHPDGLITTDQTLIKIVAPLELRP